MFFFGLCTHAQTQTASGFEQTLEIRSNSEVFAAGGEPVTVDVFWCAQSQNPSAFEAAATAGAIANSAIVSDAASMGGSFDVTTVRTRKVPDSLIGSADYSFNENTFVYSADSAGEMLRLIGELKPGLPVNVSQTQERAVPPGYLGVYLCGHQNPWQTNMRMFLQVANEQDINGALDARTTLMQEFDMISIARGIEVVDERAPDHNQIRYFFPEDRDASEAVAKELSAQIGQDVSAVFVDGYATTANMGTIEAWFSPGGLGMQ